MEIKVVTYNMLSPHYVKPHYFPDILPINLDANCRLKRSIELIKQWMKDEYIICLQELCEEWKNELVIVFQQSNYMCHCAVYKKGITGVMIAHPTHRYDYVNHEVFSCADIIKATAAPQVGCPYLDELNSATMIENMALVVQLSSVSSSSNRIFQVATYHMPCNFTKKLLMVSHVNALKLKLNHENTIIAGDFNIAISNAEYRFLVELPYDELPEFVTQLKQLSPEPTQVFRSAHLTLHGAEPIHTNVGTIKTGLFIECLDYILVTRSFTVVECSVGLVAGDPQTTTYPNELCPSDHQPLFATINLF